MPVERIYIARHGFRLNWVTNDWRSETNLPRDPPLAAYGVTQAKELAAHVASLPEDKRPTAIFSSAFYRCLQTSTPVAEALGVPLYVEHGIGEWFSPVARGTGLHPRPGTPSSLKQYFPLIDTRWSPTWFPSRKGETVSQVHDRSASFLEAFFTRLGAIEERNSSKDASSSTRSSIGSLEEPFELELGRHKNVLFVGHAASVAALTRVLVGDRDLPMRVGCCSLTTLIPKLDAKRSGVDGKGTPLVGEWDIVVKAGANFLQGGVERDWGFEDIEVSNGEVVDDLGVPGTEGEEEDPKDFGLQIHLPTHHTSSSSNSRL